MRKLLFLLLLSAASPLYAVEAVTIVGPVQVRFGTAGSTPTVAISDGLWTPYSPNNIAYMLGKVGIGTSAPTHTLDILGELNVSSGTNSFEIGTVDAYGRPQIWNKNTNAVLRLGSATSDGDLTNADASGLVIYEHSNNYYAYHKADELGLYFETSGSPYFLADSTSIIYRSGSTGVGLPAFYVNRSSLLVGIGTSTPNYRLQVSSGSGFAGTVFAVSTGSTDLFRVLGSSVHLSVPLVFPDGTSQATAGVSITSAALFYSGSNIYSKSNSMTGSVSGTDNLAIGDYTLNGTVSGSYNTAIGYLAMRFNTSGSGNAAIGIGALNNNSSGGYNTAIGQSALENNTDGGHNIGLGYQSIKLLQGTGSGYTGQFNIGLGYQALYGLQTGDGNIALGYRAGFNGGNYTASAYNIYIGQESGFSVTNNSVRNVMIGYQAGYNETGSDKLYISSGPSSSPLIKGDFAAQTLNINGSVTISSAASSFTIVGSTAAGPFSTPYIYLKVLVGSATAYILSYQ